MMPPTKIEDASKEYWFRRASVLAERNDDLSNVIIDLQREVIRLSGYNPFIKEKAMNYEDTLRQIEHWHHKARPEPTDAQLAVQVGCHIEEFLEMIMAIGLDEHLDQDIDIAYSHLEKIASDLKSGKSGVEILHREGLLDSLADQIVTAVGVGYCAKMNVPEACVRVDASNWSKYDEYGDPIFKEGGKIAKGPDYTPPDLTGLY